MRSLQIVVLLVLIPAYSGVTEESPTVKKVRNFFVEVFGKTVSAISESSDISYNIIGLPYKIYDVDSKYMVKISEDNTTIYGYTKKDLDENVTGKTSADAISEDDAFNAVKPVLKYLELSTSKSDYQMSFRDMGTEDDRADDLWGCMWTIVGKDMEMNKMPCRGRGFVGAVSGASQTITTFCYLPVIMPENELSLIITYAEARQKALIWLQKKPYFEKAIPSLTGDENTGIQVIAPKRDSFDNNRGEPTKLTKTYYCWEIPFVSSKLIPEQSEGAVWINVETGEVVGAGYR